MSNFRAENNMQIQNVFSGDIKKFKLTTCQLWK